MVLAQDVDVRDRRHGRGISTHAHHPTPFAGLRWPLHASGRQPGHPETQTAAVAVPGGRATESVVRGGARRRRWGAGCRTVLAGLDLILKQLVGCGHAGVISTGAAALLGASRHHGAAVGLRLGVAVDDRCLGAVDAVDLRLLAVGERFHVAAMPVPRPRITTLFTLLGPADGSGCRPEPTSMSLNVMPPRTKLLPLPTVM